MKLLPLLTGPSRQMIQPIPDEAAHTSGAPTQYSLTAH